VSSASLSIEWRTLELSIEGTLEDCTVSCTSFFRYLSKSKSLN
jgi:hypothetical protein